MNLKTLLLEKQMTSWNTKPVWRKSVKSVMKQLVLGPFILGFKFTGFVYKNLTVKWLVLDGDNTKFVWLKK